MSYTLKSVYNSRHIFIQSMKRYTCTHRSSVPHLLSYSVYMSVGYRWREHHLSSSSVYMSVLLQVKYTQLSLPCVQVCGHGVTGEMCSLVFIPCACVCVVTGEMYTPVFIPYIHVCVVTGEMCHTCLHALGAPSGQSGHAAPMGVHLHASPWPGVHRVTAQHTSRTDGIIQGLQLWHTVCGGGPWLWPGDKRWQVSLQRGHRVDVQHTQRVSGRCRNSSQAQKLASSNWFRSLKTMHANERREVTTPHCLQLFLRATFRADFTEFLHIWQISPTSWPSAHATHSGRK